MGISTPLRNRFWQASILFLTILVGLSTARAQNDPNTNLEDFVHYALVANTSLAEAHARALLDGSLSNEQLAELVDDQPALRDRFTRAIDWARRVPELESTINELAHRIEQGRLGLAHSPRRLTEAIAMLGGTRRDQLLAAGRLRAAGEYAVPGLVTVITNDSTDERVRWNAEQILQEIGREAVTPMTVALLKVAPNDQRRLIEILDRIGYAHAAAALSELARNEDTPKAARDAAVRALGRLGVAPDTPPGELHSELARMYFDERDELVARPLNSINNIWTWDDHGGLMTIPVPTRLYPSIMAMRSAERAMAHEPMDQSALAVYVAANLRRENRLNGQADPLGGQQGHGYSPQFHATVHGPGIGQDVLVLALDSKDTPLVRDALTALAATSGQGNLFGRYAGREPLIDAMHYPDRRVQFESALVLARALPDRGFPASSRVVPLLASAVRTGGEEYAIVVADSPEDRQVGRDRLTAMGFTVVGGDRSIERLADAISQAPGIDLVWAQPGTIDGANQAIDRMRSTSRTVNSPILFSVPTSDLPSYHAAFDGDVRVGLVRSGASDQAFDSTLELLMNDASGGRMTGVDADIYAIESLDALKSIAMVRPLAYNIKDAEPALIEALAERDDTSRLLVAEILAQIDSPASQRALMDAAMASDAGDDRVPLLDYTAASVRRYGDNITDAQMAELTQMIGGGGGDEADAAARLRGAINRPLSSAASQLAGSPGS